MNVKCPKCRFRFDVLAPVGMTELQCNCPRCGTPFTYAVDGSETTGASTSSNAGENGMETAGREATTSQSGSPYQHSSKSNTSDQSHEKKAVPPPPPSGGQAVPPPFQDPRQVFGSLGRTVDPTSQPQHRGWLRWIIVSAVVGIAFMVILVQQCGSSKSYTADDVGLTESGPVDGASSTGDVSNPDFDESAPIQKAPAWIQGNWHVETDYGGISVRIRGNSIEETSAGGTSRGRFKYQNNRLYCNFGDKQVFVYRLVDETKQIDAGNGILMNKTK